MTPADAAPIFIHHLSALSAGPEGGMGGVLLIEVFAASLQFSPANDVQKARKYPLKLLMFSGSGAPHGSVLTSGQTTSVWLDRLPAPY